MQMKNLMESFNTFLSEEKGDNVALAIRAIEAEGYDYEILPRGNTIRITDDNREDALDKMIAVLEPLGFEHNTSITQHSLGRLEKIDRLDGNVYILFKPKSRTRAATAGIDFEKKLAAMLQDAGLEAKTAGLGPGSDLTITGPKGTLKIEVKTTLSSDFGQFRAEYDPNEETWQPRETAGYVANEELFKPIFNQLLLPYLNENCMLPLADPRLRRDRDGQIAGLKSSSTTGDLKQKLQEAWFDGRKDYITNFDFAAIARYYGDKGDEYIQIGRSGLYAFNEQAAQNLGVPLFVNSGLEAYVRFRIKPHGATNGTHSFTVAIKIRGRLERSSKSLLNPADIEEIKNILS
jgi:hypothetical protein